MSGNDLVRFTVETLFGPVAIVASSRGLLSLTIASRAPAIGQPPPRFSGLAESLKAYFKGIRVTFIDVKLDLSEATPFQARVWAATQCIPYGEIRKYRMVAEETGQPNAVRAVGQALGRNPLPVIIPCHRVIASNGYLGGYSSGLKLKQQLLDMEHRSIFPE